MFQGEKGDYYEKAFDHSRLGLQRRRGNSGRPENLCGARHLRHERDRLRGGGKYVRGSRRAGHFARYNREADRRRVSGHRHRRGKGRHALQIRLYAGRGGKAARVPPEQCGDRPRDAGKKRLPPDAAGFDGYADPRNPAAGRSAHAQYSRSGNDHRACDSLSGGYGARGEENPRHGGEGRSGKGRPRRRRRAGYPVRRRVLLPIQRNANPDQKHARHGLYVFLRHRLQSGAGLPHGGCGTRSKGVCYRRDPPFARDWQGLRPHASFLRSLSERITGKRGEL